MIPDLASSGEQLWPTAGHSGSIDKLAAASIGLTVPALGAWVGAGWIAETTRHDDNGVIAVLMVGVAVTLTLVAGGLAIASGIRCFVHRLVDEDVQVVCRRLDRVMDRLAPPVPVSAPPTNGTDIAEGMRGYLAGRMDHPTDTL